MARTDWPCVRFRISRLSEAFQLVEFLVTAAVWFDFMPVPDDKYDIGVRPEMQASVERAIRELGLGQINCTFRMEVDDNGSYHVVAPAQRVHGA